MSNPAESKTSRPAYANVAEAPIVPLSTWKRCRYRLEALGAKTLLHVLPLLPRSVVIRLGALVGWAAYYLMGMSRRIALANLELAFGNSKTPPEKKRIARISCQNFATTLLTFFWSPRINASNLHKVVESDEAELKEVHRIQAQGRAIIYITLHFGDWEMLGVAAPLQGIHATVVTRTMRNTELEEIFARLRGATGNRIIPRRHAAAKLLKALKRGEATALLIDQHVPARLGGIWCDFFGVPVLTSPAIAQLALHSNAVILGVVSRPIENGRIRLTYGPAIDYKPSGDKTADIRDITQRCLNFCEATIRDQPEYWLWSYKRWKTRPGIEQGRYPFYSRMAKPLPASKLPIES